jgi:ribosome-associated protein
MNNQFDENYADEWEDDYPSKSQLKRDSEALQDLGEELVNLKPSELEKVPMDEDLADAIELAHKLKGKREAWRRHLQYIGRLMRSRDTTEIEQALDVIRSRHVAGNARMHKLELLRERLIEQGDEAINELLGKYHELDRQKLRQLVRQAKKERNDNKPPVAFRELFQYLREELEEVI